MLGNVPAVKPSRAGPKSRAVVDSDVAKQVTLGPWHARCDARCDKTTEYRRTAYAEVSPVRVMHGGDCVSFIRDTQTWER